MREDWFTKRRRKLAQMNEAETAGRVADSMNVRMELVRKMHAGDMTLEDVQAELKRIKRNAKKNGQITRCGVRGEVNLKGPEHDIRSMDRPHTLR